MWSEQTQLSNGGGGNYLNRVVSLSADGNILAAGAYYENNNAGAVYIYTRDGNNNWSQQAILSGSVPDEKFGNTVSLSTADGNTLAVGAFLTNAVHVYTRDGNNWSEQTVLTGGNGYNFGWSTSLSADGNTLAVGGTY